MKYRVTPHFLLALSLLLLATLAAVLPHIGGVYGVFSDTKTVSVSLGAATGEEFCDKALPDGGDGEAGGDVEHDEDCGACEDADHGGDVEHDEGCGVCEGADHGGDVEHDEGCGVCEDADHDGDDGAGGDAEHDEDCGVCEDAGHGGDGEAGDDAFLRDGSEGDETTRPCQWRNGEPLPSGNVEPAS